MRLTVHSKVLFVVVYAKRRITEMELERMEKTELKEISEEVDRFNESFPREVQMIAAKDIHDTSDGYVIPSAKWVRLHITQTFHSLHDGVQFGDGFRIMLPGLGLTELKDTYYIPGGYDENSTTILQGYVAHTPQIAMSSKEKAGEELQLALDELVNKYGWKINYFEGHGRDEVIDLSTDQGKQFFYTALRYMGFKNDVIRRMLKVDLEPLKTDTEVTGDGEDNVDNN